MSGAAGTAPTILIVAAGGGLGYAMAEEFLHKGWRVIGTVRPGRPRTKLHDLAETANGRVEIETLDINDPAQIAALRGRSRSPEATMASGRQSPRWP